MYILLSIGILKIQFACYTQRGVLIVCERQIVYLVFKDTICMLYTTWLCPNFQNFLLPIGILRYNLHAIHNPFDVDDLTILPIVYQDFKELNRVQN